MINRRKIQAAFGWVWSARFLSHGTTSAPRVVIKPTPRKNQCLQTSPRVQSKINQLNFLLIKRIKAESLGPSYLHRHDCDAACRYHCVWDYTWGLWRWISKPTSLSTGRFTYTEKEITFYPSPPLQSPLHEAAERQQSSPSTGHSRRIRAFSLDQQVPEAEIANNSIFLGHSSISHKHCSKYNLSRLRGFFGIALQPLSLVQVIS